MAVRYGYQPEREIQTGIGPVTEKVSKVHGRGGGEPITFRAALVPAYVRKAASLEAALPWPYLKGILTGEMQTALEALVGPEAKGLSSSTVSRLKQRWTGEYYAWLQRPGTTTAGFISRLMGLMHRGLKAPKLAVGDGALGFWAALDEVFAQTRQRRCLMHKTGKVLNALPKTVQPKAKRALMTSGRRPSGKRPKWPFMPLSRPINRSIPTPRR